MSHKMKGGRLESRTEREADMEIMPSCVDDGVAVGDGVPEPNSHAGSRLPMRSTRIWALVALPLEQGSEHYHSTKDFGTGGTNN